MTGIRKEFSPSGNRIMGNYPEADMGSRMEQLPFLCPESAGKERRG